MKSTIWRSTITAWRNVHAFLKWKGIDAPRQLTRAICKEYHIWRQNPKANGGAIDGVFRCGHNNALQDLKILSIICDEAVELGFLEINPVHKLGIKKIRAEEKQPFTDEEIGMIRKALVDWPAWMSIAFEFGLHQALRLRQTSFSLSCIDWTRHTISYPAHIVKGSKPFTHPIDERVLPLLAKLKADGAKVTCVIPPTKNCRARHGGGS